MKPLQEYTVESHFTLSSLPQHTPLNVAIALPILQVETPPQRGRDTCPKSKSPKLECSGVIHTWIPWHAASLSTAQVKLAQHLPEV